MGVLGYQSTSVVLTTVTLDCSKCEKPAKHALVKAISKVSLFPSKIRFSTQCTACGRANRLNEDDATRLFPTANDPLKPSQGGQWVL